MTRALPARTLRLSAAVALAATLLLAGAGNAAASVVRLRFEWAPTDGRSAMYPPYLFASSQAGISRYQGHCSGAGNCANEPGTRWVEGNLDAGGYPRTISFVDDTATQYSTFTLSAAHPFSGFGPDVVGTAFITHADGRTYSVPFTLHPSSGLLPEQTQLGSSEGLPRPPDTGGSNGPRPVLGEVVVVKAKGELVRIRRPGETKFSVLKGSQEVPIGSLLDTRKGKVKLTSAKDSAGHGQTAHFSGGVFKVLQSHTSPLTTLRLAGRLRGCARSRAAGRLEATAARRRRGRRLWGSGKGRFRTRGRRSAATVRGTRWLVADLCDRSTLTRVAFGEVAVRDFVRHKTVLLKTGQEYVARPRRH